jgi:hypothetical protein
MFERGRKATAQYTLAQQVLRYFMLLSALALGVPRHQLKFCALPIGFGACCPTVLDSNYKCLLKNTP